MPIVTLEVAGELSKEKKAELIRKVSQAVHEVTDKRVESIYTKIVEIARENFGVGEKQLG